MTDKALLVGINAYPGDNALSGCINDVDDMARFITASCGFQPEGMRFLKDGAATRQGIVAALAELVDSIQPGDRILFHFSGHGAQMASRSGGEIDGLDEVICPIDFDWSEEHAIRDKEFHALFGSVPVGVEFVWVSDSCHSGDLPREMLRDGTTKARVMVPTPPEVEADIVEARLKGFQTGPLFTQGASLNVAFVAGCKSSQTSADATFNDRPNGALTYFLLRELEVRLQESLATVVPNVVEALRASGYQQEPQLEGSTELAARSFLQP